MLKHLRNKSTQKKIYILIAIAVLPAFLVWGIKAGDESKASPFTLGSIEGQKISATDYKNSYSALLHQLQMMYGDKATQLAPMFNLRGQAMDRILLLHYAKKNGLKTSDKEVVEWIGSHPIFVEKGEFNTEMYRAFVERYLHTTTRTFEEETRGTLTIEKIRKKEKTEINVSDEELRKIYDTQNGPKTVAYVVMMPDPADADKKTVTQDEIDKVLPLLSKQLVDETTKQPLEKAAAEEKVKKIIAEQKAKSDVLKKARELREKMEKDGFEKAAADASLTVSTLENYVKDGEIGSLGKNPSFDRELSQLKENEISVPVALENGVLLAQVKKSGTADTAAFEKEKDSFKENYLDSKSEDGLDKILSNMRDKAKINADAVRKLFGDEPSPS